MYGERKPEFDPDELMRNLKANWGGIFSRLPGGGNRGIIIAAVIALIAVVWAGSGIYTVGPGEQAALRLFGKFTGTQGTLLERYAFLSLGKNAKTRTL